MRLASRFQSTIATTADMITVGLDRRLNHVSTGTQAGAAMDPLNHHSTVRNFGLWGRTTWRHFRFGYGRGGTA